DRARQVQTSLQVRLRVDDNLRVIDNEVASRRHDQARCRTKSESLEQLACATRVPITEILYRQLDDVKSPGANTLSQLRQPLVSQRRRPDPSIRANWLGHHGRTHSFGTFSPFRI